MLISFYTRSFKVAKIVNEVRIRTEAEERITVAFHLRVMMENQLSPELIAQGWSKCWSKRERRFYYFNTLSSASSWDIPPDDGAGPSHIHQKLGYDLAGNSATTTKPNPGITLASSCDEGTWDKAWLGLPGPWNLKIPANVFPTAVSRPSYPPPHPLVEHLRYKLVKDLREIYEEEVKSKLNISPPKESFSRWLMAQRINDSKADPLFPSCHDLSSAISYSLMEEIMADLPIRILPPRFQGEAIAQFLQFARASKSMIQNSSRVECTNKMTLLEVINEAIEWMNSNAWIIKKKCWKENEIAERLTQLQNLMEPFVYEATHPTIEGICKKLSLVSRDNARQIRKVQSSLFAQSGDMESSVPHCGRFTEEAEREQARVSSVYPRLDKQDIIIQYETGSVQITKKYIQKLTVLYLDQGASDSVFMYRVFCMLRRYNAFTDEFKMCQSTEGSLPIPVFECLHKNFGVTFECFASPLNTYFRNYCSAFPDTDAYFGSSGTFLDFWPKKGSFQMYPPFVPDLIIASINHLHILLSASQEPLSFIIFLPEIKDNNKTRTLEPNWMKIVQNSRWRRAQIQVQALCHEYRAADYHVLPKCLLSHHPTTIIWFQNEAGFEKWKPLEESVKEVHNAFLISTAAESSSN